MVSATPPPQTDLLRIATAGSVDDGKSTLVGRLLHDSKAILADTLADVKKTSKARGFAGTDEGIDFALLTDGLRAEREQGITIDVAYRYLRTKKRSFILADCPGHTQYTKNTVTGASTADAAVVLVDARKGILQQTLRHLSVIHLLRVPHLIVAVNKVDLVDFSQERFEKIVEDIHSFLDLLAERDTDSPESLRRQSYVIPISALEGDNVVEKSMRTPWYRGPSLMQVLETLPSADEMERHSTGNFRLPVQMVIRSERSAITDSESAEAEEFRGYASLVASGTVRVGDSAIVQPSGVKSEIAAIHTSSERSARVAFAGDSVLVELRDAVDVTRGDTIVDAAEPPLVSGNLDASLCWLSNKPLHAGARVLLKHGTAIVPAAVETVHGKNDLQSARLIPDENLSLNDIGSVRIKLGRGLPLEKYSMNRRTGSFLLISARDGNTLAAGMITSVEGDSCEQEL